MAIVCRARSYIVWQNVRSAALILLDGMASPCCCVLSSHRHTLTPFLGGQAGIILVFTTPLCHKQRQDSRGVGRRTMV